nr:hypothetical protein [Stakelama sediminis]
MGLSSHLQRVGESAVSGKHESASESGVERLPTPRKSSVTNELNAILLMLKEACPEKTVITFDFDGALRVHLDVRATQDIWKIEGLLPTLGGGIFRDIKRGSTPHHPFFHRVSAVVDR